MTNFEHYLQYINRDKYPKLMKIVNKGIEAEENYDKDRFNTAMMLCRQVIEEIIKWIAEQNDISTDKKELSVIMTELAEHLKWSGYYQQKLHNTRYLGNQATHDIDNDNPTTAYHLIKDAYNIFDILYKLIYAPRNFKDKSFSLKYKSRDKNPTTDAVKTEVDKSSASKQDNHQQVKAVKDKPATTLNTQPQNPVSQNLEESLLAFHRQNNQPAQDNTQIDEKISDTVEIQVDTIQSQQKESVIQPKKETVSDKSPQNQVKSSKPKSNPSAKTNHQHSKNHSSKHKPNAQNTKSEQDKAVKQEKTVHQTIQQNSVQPVPQENIDNPIPEETVHEDITSTTPNTKSVKHENIKQVKNETVKHSNESEILINPNAVLNLFNTSYNKEELYKFIQELKHNLFPNDDFSSNTRITALDVSNRNLTELKDLKKYQRLKTLDISYNPILDYTDLTKLKNIKTLLISLPHKIDISFFSEMEKLEKLYILSENVFNLNLSHIAKEENLAEPKNIKVVELFYLLNTICQFKTLNTLFIFGQELSSEKLQKFKFLVNNAFTCMTATHHVLSNINESD